MHPYIGYFHIEDLYRIYFSRLSIMEGGAAEEFAEKRCGGNLVSRDGFETAEQTQQSIGYGIVGSVFGHLSQQRLRICLHHSNLENQRGVECGIRILTVGEYPLLLATTHAWPAAYSVERGDVAIFVVAHHTAQKTVVARGDPVVIVDL